MADGRVNPLVDAHLGTAKRWRDELERLRVIVLDCPLVEELKWGRPCYTYEGSNVVMLYAFKEYCAIGFFKGSLLNDAIGILTRPGENSRAMRQIRFTNVEDIVEMETILKTYIHDAIEVEKSGLEVAFEKNAGLIVPEELRTRLSENPTLKAAFEALTPGRQRGYVLYFSEPKQAKTRESRIEKCMQQIINGKGLNDRRS
jgi:uncharacterized protein YdeI (YjbR/CyaY-like superfamily)